MNEYKILEALSQPIRVRILGELVRAYPSKLTVTQLQKNLKNPRMTIWFHIKKLREAGLIELDNSGKGFRATIKRLNMNFNGNGFHLEVSKE